MGKYRFFPIFFLLLLVENLVAQPAAGPNADTSQIPYIDISKITLSQEIAEKIEFTYIDPTETLSEKYGQLAFSRMTLKKRFVSKNNVTKKAILRFKLVNTSDTTHSCWFFPWLYFWDAQLYQLDANQLQKIPSVLPEKPKEISYRLITLPAHDSATIVVELRLVRTHLNAISPVLMSREFLSSYVKDLDATNMESKIITYLFCGLLLMMILFSLATYSQGGNPEFLFYSGYAFFLGMMLFIKAIHSYHTSWFSFFQETYLDLIMQNTGILMYMLFMQKFLATHKRHPFLHKFYNVGILLLIVSTLLYTYVHYFTYNFPLENRIENITKLILLAMIVIFLVYSTRYWHDRLLVYLFWGNLCLLLFSLFSLLMLTGNIVPRNLPAIFKSSLFYYEIGLLLEL